MPPSSIFCEITAAVHTKRERRKDARPGELLNAALDLFIEKGFSATRVEEVALRAGVSKGTLFLYFSSKEELFKAVVRKNLSGQFEEWNTMFDSFPGTTPEMLQFCLYSWWERIGSTKASGITKLMMSEAGNFPELAEFYKEEVMRPGNVLIERLIQRGMDRGEFRKVDAKKTVFTVMAPLVYLALWGHSFGKLKDNSPQFKPDDVLATLLDTLLNGLCPSPVKVNTDPITMLQAAQPCPANQRKLEKK
jgi:TetR/AcrR family transcriptional regulator